MNKKNTLWIMLDLVFLVVFNVVFFVVTGTKHPASVWISYGFIHFSYIMLLVTPFLIRDSSSVSVFGFALYSVSSTYFFVAFIVGLIFIFAKPESYKGSLVAQVIIAGIYAIMLLSNMIANENTAENVERHEIELQYVNKCSARLKSVMDIVEDKHLRKSIEKAYDLLHSSPVKSRSDVRDYEVEVIELIESLDGQITNGDLDAVNATINKIIRTANERNRRLKY